MYLAVQEFSKSGTPMKLSDFDRLELDKADIDVLQHCKPGDCDLQIFSQIEETQKLVDWKSPDKYTKVNQVVRRRFFDEMSLYQKGGLKEFGSYRDRGTPFSLYQSMKDMVDQAHYLPKDKASDIYGHVVEYPQAKMKGAEDIFYWEKIDFGQGPVIRVNHVSLFPAGFGAAKLIGANKQLFASKYMRAALQMYYCIPDRQEPNKPGFYLITMSYSRLPDFGGLKLSIVRKIATSSAVAERGTLFRSTREERQGNRLSCGPEEDECGLAREQAFQPAGSPDRTFHPGLSAAGKLPRVSLSG